MLWLAFWLGILRGSIGFRVEIRSLTSIVEMSKKPPKQQSAAKREALEVLDNDEASASQPEDESFGTPQPSRRQSALQAPSSSSRDNDGAPRQKQRTVSQCAGCQAKPQADAKNWSKTCVDTRGKTVAEGHLCFRCGDYCAGLDITIDDFIMSCANQKSKPLVLKNVADFASGKAQPELRGFPLEKIFAETRFTSTMEELCISYNANILHMYLVDAQYVIVGRCNLVCCNCDIYFLKPVEFIKHRAAKPQSPYDSCLVLAVVHIDASLRFA
jgi:hypothetical protein